VGRCLHPRLRSGRLRRATDARRHRHRPEPRRTAAPALGNCLPVGYAANTTADGITRHGLRIELAGKLDLGAFPGLRPGHAGFDTITATVHLDTDADPEHVQLRYQAVVGSSPVGPTLQAAIPVAITLAEEAARWAPPTRCWPTTPPVDLVTGAVFPKC